MGRFLLSLRGVEANLTAYKWLFSSAEIKIVASRFIGIDIDKIKKGKVACQALSALFACPYSLVMFSNLIMVFIF